MPLPGLPSQRGFTLVEVLVAITILLVGVLGVVALVDGANAVSVKNKGREGASNVARSIIEVGRAVRYRELSAGELIVALNSRPGLSDSSPGTGHTIESRGFNYDVTLQVCSMDDPADGLGLNDPAVTFCPQSSHAATSADVNDRNPDDYRRIAVTLGWNRGGGTETVTQTSVVSNPVGGLGPSIAELRAVGYSGSSVTVTSGLVNVIDFDVSTTTDAAQVTWSISGDPQGNASAVGASERDWTFRWDINGSTGGQYWHDCTYVVQASAFDEQGRSGKPGALTVVLNRRQPFAPDFLEGGRNGWGNDVDLRWPVSPECDVLGYRVYRQVGTGPREQVACHPDTTPQMTAEPECIDRNAPSGTVSYEVVAVDSNGDGDSASLTVGSSADQPAPPSNLSACLGGTVDCNGPDGNPAPDGVTVLRWDASADPVAFYRIYRDGNAYADRYDRFFPSQTGGLAWMDPSSPDGQHSYYMTAVSPTYGESSPIGPVVFP